MRKEARLAYLNKLQTAKLAHKSGQGAADIEFAPIPMVSPTASTSNYWPHRFILSKADNVKTREDPLDYDSV